jgi:leucyl/phenylalanyl-tRNA--protein transferase
MRSPGLYWISPSDPPQSFPDIELALREPNGLLAAGGDLSTERLIYAYRNGIFPWFDAGQPILWWSPDPRCVIEPRALHLSRRNRRALRSSGYSVAFNRRFADVLDGCAAARPGQRGTWITDSMREAYGRLHRQGWAHSIEVLKDGQLVGGLYGLAIGRVFFGESMFSAAANASKAALLVLCHLLEEHGFALLDGQVESRHLMSLGATLMPRMEFRTILEGSCRPVRTFDAWPAHPVQVAAIDEAF